jgi:TPR repeat protein
MRRVYMILMMFYLFQNTVQAVMELPKDSVTRKAFIQAIHSPVNTLVATNTFRTNPWPSLKITLAAWSQVPMSDVIKKAQAGDTSAQHYLGYCFTQGMNTNKSTEQGLRWYHLAADAGFAPSLNNIGVIYQHGIGVEINKVKAYQYYLKAAEKLFPSSMYNLGKLCVENPEITGGPANAENWYLKAAEYGNGPAMLELNFLYREGTLVPMDLEKADRMLVNAAMVGDPYAQCCLGYALQPVRLDIHCYFNQAEAIYWFKKSAEQNWAGGQYNLGKCYLSGDGVEKDEERAVALFRAAADQGHYRATCQLAEAYSAGIDQPRSTNDTPIELYKRATAYINIRSWYYKTIFDRIVKSYEIGQGTPRDIMESIRWYCRAAKLQLPQYSLRDKNHFLPPRPSLVSMQPIGVYSRYSNDERQDPCIRLANWGNQSERFLLALSYYLKSAEGDAASMEFIALMYDTGNNVPQSSVKALAWYIMSQKAGNKAQDQKITAIQNRLEPSERNEVNRLVSALEKELHEIKSQLDASQTDEK